MSGDGSAPRVSVVLPAYDEPEFLVDAVRSVRAQTMPDFELLVVDDGSPREDAIREAFREAAAGDPRARLIRQVNAGGSAARNRGIAEARGAWIAFLDHDDRWLPRKLEAQLAAADAADERPGLVFCQFREFDEGMPLRDPFPQAVPDLRGSGTLTALLRGTWIRTLSVVLVARDALPDTDWFRTDLAVANDIELYYRLACRRPFAFVAEPLVEKRRHDRNVTRDLLRMHLEAVRIVDELAERLGDGKDEEQLRRPLRTRLLRHLLGASRAARRGGDRGQALAHAGRAVRTSPLDFDAHWAFLRALMTRRPSA
jgi:glycosyltransferase involved in cell wall biosynthesis